MLYTNVHTDRDRYIRKKKKLARIDNYNNQNKVFLLKLEPF